MRRIAYYSLIEVTYLNLNVALGVGDRSKIAYVTVSTNPYLGATRNRLDVGAVEPFVKLAGVATHICMRGAGHLQTAAGRQNDLSIAKPRELANFPFHVDKR